MNADAARDKVHRALADRHRARIVDELGRSPHGLDVQDLGERLGLHANTVRWHLGVLADAGIVHSAPEPRSTPGRPRILYSLSQETDAGDSESYRLLATVLAGALGELDNGAELAEAAGRSWARYVVDVPVTGVSDEAARQELSGMLADQGFRPEIADDGIHMHHCPYRELAPGIVCSVHRGLLAGTLTELGTDLELDALDVFVEPQLCVARLRRRDADRAIA